MLAAPWREAAGTRGRALADGAREIKLLGTYVRVRAEIVDLPSFSVHADHGELLSWLESASNAPDTTYLVHGEPDAAGALHDAIEDDLDWEAVVCPPPRTGSPRLTRSRFKRS